MRNKRWIKGQRKPLGNRCVFNTVLGNLIDIWLLTLLFFAVDNSSQIAYLENLLKMYNDEIHRLQKSELSLDDLDSEDSSFVQENKLKRKVSPNHRTVDGSRAVRIGYFTTSFSIPTFSVNEDLWKVVWAKRLQHTYRQS